MEYRILVFVFFSLYNISISFSQNTVNKEYNNKTYYEWYYEKSDTIYKVIKDSSSNSLLQLDYYVHCGEQWCCYYLNNNIKEMGNFKRREKTIFSCFISKLKLNGNCWKYRVKINEWYYFDINGILIKKEEFNNKGFIN